jgi:tetratricopeptide (TPR) repeat protein
LAIAFARSLYRDNKYDQAEKLLFGCRTYVTKYIVNDSFPNFGTLGEIAYLLGRIERQRQHFVRALQEFNTAIESYNDRILCKRQNKVSMLAAEEAFSMHKVATIVALAVSWCNYSRGALTTALFGNLIPSQMLLRNSGDVLNSAYADVVYSSTARAYAGQNRRKLLQLREIVTNAQSVFERYKHRYYTAGAALELSLIALALGDWEKANDHLKTIWNNSSARDVRWCGSALIVESRILRHKGRYKDAARSATKAFRIAMKNRERLTQIDALIARSEAYGGDGKRLDLAVADLQKALTLNRIGTGANSSANPKVHANCHLHLVQTFLALKRMSDAVSSFGEWERVREVVGHRSLHEFAERLAPEVESEGVFHLDTNVRGLKLRANMNSLRDFLLRRASARGRSQRKIGELLGVTPQAVAKIKQEAARRAGSTDG